MCEQACQPESRRSPTPEIFNGSYAAKTPPRTPGQKLPVRLKAGMAASEL